MVGYLGNGATLKFGTTNTISEIQSIATPSYEADDINVTTHNDTNRFMTFTKGLTDAGAIDIDGLVNSTEYNTLRAFAETTTMQSVTITVPTGPSVCKFECNGYVKSLSMDVPHDDVIAYSMSVKVSGKPTFSLV